MPLLINCFMTSMGLAEIKVASSRTVRNSGTSIICLSFAIRDPPCEATQRARLARRYQGLHDTLSNMQCHVVCLLKIHTSDSNNRRRMYSIDALEPAKHTEP